MTDGSASPSCLTSRLTHTHTHAHAFCITVLIVTDVFIIYSITSVPTALIIYDLVTKITLMKEPGCMNKLYLYLSRRCDTCLCWKLTPARCSLLPPTGPRMPLFYFFRIMLPGAFGLPALALSTLYCLP